MAGIEAQLAEVSTSAIRSKIDGRNTDNEGKAEVELADVLRDLELELANAKQKSEEASKFSGFREFSDRSLSSAHPHQPCRPAESQFDPDRRP